MHQLLTQERLKLLLDYNPETGLFTRTGRAFNYTKGEIAGTEDSRGYICIKLDGITYKAHNLAVLYMTGSFVEDGYEVDHIELNNGDNRWDKLRIGTKAQNCYNRKTRVDSVSGIKGVKWDKPSSKWMARISVNGFRHTLGRFTTIEEAENVIKAFREQHYKEFCRH